MSAATTRSYPHIAMWHARTWADRFSSVIPLVERIEVENHEFLRHHGTVDLYDHRTDGLYTSKTCSVAYPDVLAHWAAKGLTFVCDEMAQVNWIALLPPRPSGVAADRRTLLVVLHEADYANRNWAMNTLEYFRPYNEFAAERGYVLLFVVPERPDMSNTWINVIQELAVRFHLDYDHVFLDLSPLWRSGTRLADIADFTYRDSSSALVDPPDDAIEELDGVPVLDISGRWQNSISQLYRNVVLEAHLHPDFDIQALVHSDVGRALARAMAIEHRFTHVGDPDLTDFLTTLGVRLTRHDAGAQQWVTLTPLDPAPGRDLPLMVIFQEVTELDPFQPVSALSLFFGFVELVGRGELACLFFALETPDDNDLALDLIAAAAEESPIDLGRVYVIGHSHNGHFAREFARRHPHAVAGLAQLGNHYGLPAPGYSREVVKISDDMLESMRAIDMPTVVIGADSEGDYSHAVPGSRAFDDAVDAWRRRALVFDIEPASAEQITAVRSSPDPALRVVGIPGDRSTVREILGTECYIIDFANRSGKIRLRLVAIQNMIHMCAPQMPELAWDYLKHFARDRETGVIVDIPRINQ